MARGELAPEPWASEMVAAGFVSPRTGAASLKQLAEAAGLGPSTVHRLLSDRGNRGTPDARTVTKLADALGLEAETVWARLGVEGGRSTVPKTLDVQGLDILETADWTAIETVARRLVSQRRRVIAAEAGKLIGAAR